MNGVADTNIGSSPNFGQPDNSHEIPSMPIETPILELFNSNHISASIASNDSQSDADDNSACSTSSEHIDVSKPVRPVRRKLTGYPMSKAYSTKSPLYSTRPTLSKNKSKGKNGLVRMHSLDVQDMHDIVGDLELASSHESLSTSSINERPYLDRDTFVNEAVEIDMTDSNRSDNAYALSRLSESPPPPLEELDSEPLSSPTRTPTSDDHSAVILSPLTERTTPISFSSFDNQTDPSSMASSYVTVVPAPLADDLNHDGVTIEVVPYAPPQFAGEELTNLDRTVFTGRGKGIAGSAAVHSGFIESVLYLLSLSTDLLLQDLETSYSDIRNVLVESVTLPLQRFVSFTSYLSFHSLCSRMLMICG